jgi:hypothetical protein
MDLELAGKVAVVTGASVNYVIDGGLIKTT